MKILFRHRGNFHKTEKFLKKSFGKDYLPILEKYANQGVDALAAATPVDTGLTASLWGYRIIEEDGKISIIWENYNVQKGINIAVILQYGHGTRNGGYVVGRDYINPALRPIFDKMAEAVWKEVTSI